MPIMDFTLSNPLIRNFLEGKDEKYVPTGELMYVHTHFISNNFLSEIEVMVSKTQQVLEISPKKSKQAYRLVNATVELGGLLPDINETTAPRIMYLLRDIYQTCHKVLSSVTIPTQAPTPKASS